MIGVLVSGQGTNLQALLDERLPVCAVASDRREAPAVRRALARGIPTAVFEAARFRDRDHRDAAMAAWLEGRGAGLVVLAGYMRLLRPSFLGRFPGRVVNVHPSLLPAFPGLHAVERALEAGVAETGATVHLVDEGVDTGPVLLQEAVRVEPGDTPASLHARIKAVEHRLLPRAVRALLAERRAA
jgi:phosphoribosylglycinamide formyltransferase-1